MRHSSDRERCRYTLLLLAVIFGCWNLRAWAAPPPEPCSTGSATRQLDFWLGSWTITYPNAAGSSTSKVSLSLNRCLFVESWDNGEGHSGENLFAYSPEDKSWHGMFADNQGRVHIFLDGKVSGGAAEFHGPSLGPNGKTVLNRVRIVRLAPGKVEQVWEKSSDNGTTWKAVFRGEYTRTGA